MMKELVKNLPSSPGIYKMKNAKGEVIYVGKAKNLRNRVKTYFQKDYQHSSRTRKLIEYAADIECIETDTELEALLLETNLIKELRPKYNILMKDDKSYAYIKVNMNEDFPRIRVVRERTLEKTGEFQQKAKYFGPKLASTKVYETLRILKKLFPFRHCNLDIEWKESKIHPQKQHDNLQIAPNKNLVNITNRVIDYPCLDYFIKRCPGPCIGAISPDEYKKIVQQVVNFLGGKNDELEKSLEGKMLEAASQKLFEKAARLRDKLFALKSISEKQKVSDPARQDTDVINFSSDLGRLYFNILMIRNGKLVGQENFMLDALEMKELEAPIDLIEALRSFLIQYYEKAADVPKEIFIPEELEEKEALEVWLTKLRGDRVHILSPQRGEKNKLLELSHKNAVSFGKQYRIKWLAQERGETALARLAEVLGIKGPLRRIEGYDISHLGGNETVGSMVVFENGSAKSSDYRHFKLRTIDGKPDDYRSMEEVLMRRLKYLSRENSSIAMRKPSKKLFAHIKEKLNIEGPAEAALDPKTFSCFLQGKEMVGFIQLSPASQTAGEISNLWMQEKYRDETLGYQFMKRAMEKSKFKKFYVATPPDRENYYAEFGFQSVKEVPAFFGSAKDKTLMVMERKALSYADLSFKAKPNLMGIDGGKGQLNTALLALKRLKLEIPVVSLAKRLEEIYLPGEKAPLLLEEGDEALKLLQRIRDESHRFAITFQRKLHQKNLILQ